VGKGSTVQQGPGRAGPCSGGCVPSPGRRGERAFAVPDGRGYDRAVAVPHHVLLVPGFFGFATLGDFAYFAHVQELLAEALPKVGVRGAVEVVHTIPTATLQRRAALLAETISRLLEAGPAEVSLVGHSSGGLDARYLVSPGVSLPAEVDVERCARAVRAVVTVSTPHRGTPVADTFNTLLGPLLLKLLSLVTIYGLRAGRLPIGVVLRIARLLGRRDAPETVLQQLWVQLLGDFSPDRRQAIESFFDEVGADRGLVAQITPAGAASVDAATPDRPAVRYGCVVTRACPPGLRSFLGAGVDPYAHATHGLFVALYRLAARSRADLLLPPAPVAALTRAFRRPVDHHTNDGMVPTLSQFRGELIRAAWADHYDVIGHFHHPTHVPPHFDWVASGSRFTLGRFESLWREVAAFVAAAGRGR
jgi:triacylglycerol lipase